MFLKVPFRGLLVLFVLFVSCFHTTQAQNPGGVAGSNLWLKADAGTTNSGADLTGWTDQTGTNTFTVSGDPQTGVSAINFNNAIDFDGTGDFLNGNTAITFQTLYAVVKLANTNFTSTVMSASNGNENNGYIMKGNKLATGNNLGAPNALYFQSAGNLDATKGRLAVVEIVPGQNATGSKSYIDGQFFATQILAGGGSVMQTFSSTPYVGRSQDPANSDYFQGQIAELIMYPTSHNDVERIKIESYLALKYGITLDVSETEYLASNGTIVWNNTTYWNDVFGIGKDDGNGLNQTASNSINTGSGDGTGQSGKGNISLINPSSLDDGDFLMIGHDNGALTEQATDLPTGSNFLRLAREWKVKHTGDVGTITMNFSTLGLTVSGSATNDFKLLIDRDGDGDFATGTIDEISATAYGLNIVLFNGLAIPDGAVFTLVTGKQVGPGVLGANLWLKADAGTTNSGADLTGWADKTGTNTFTVNGTPQLQNQVLNFNPTVEFANGTSGAGQAANRLDGNAPIKIVEAFGVFKYTSAGLEGVVLGGTQASTSNNAGAGIFTGVFGFTLAHDLNGNAMAYQHSNQSSSFSISDFDISPAGITPPGFARIDGKSTTVNTFTLNPNFTELNVTPSIGGTNNSNATTPQYKHFNGKLAELIVYPNALTTVEKLKVESYLALKYGITLDASVTNYVNASGTSIWNNTTYWNDVFGIGKDDGNGLNQTASNSINTGSGDGTGQSGKGNIVLNNPSSLDDGDFLMIGNNGGALSETTADLPPSLTGFIRLEREWWVKHTGNVGSVDIAFDLNNITVTGASANQFRLLIDADGDGDFTTGQPTLILANSFAGNIVSFNGVTLPTNRAIALITEAPSPGGIASERLWLEANNGVTRSGNSVTGWADQTAINFFTVVGLPVYAENAVNFNPSIGFANTGDGSTLPASRLDGNAPITSVTAFAVMRSNTNTSTLLGSTAAGAEGIAQFGYRGDDDLTSGNGAANRFKSFTNPQRATYTIASFDVGSAPGTYTLNGAGGPLNSTGGGFTQIDLTPMIGGTLNAGPAAQRWRPFNGDIAEVIVYNSSLTAAQVLQVNSYLAVKYGLTLDPSVVNYVASDGSPVWIHTTYWNDVFGIARDDNAGLLQESSNSMNIGTGIGIGVPGEGNIVIKNPSPLDNLDYLMVGHDAGALTETTADLPASLSCFVRLEREWKIQMTGNIESVDASFDISGLTVSGTQASDFKIVIDANGDGDFTTGGVSTIDATSLNGSVVHFNIDFTQFASPDGAVFTFITGNETIPPVITCAADASRNNQALLCAYTVQGTEFDATFTDNCVGGSITNDLNNTSSIANEVLPVGVTTVVWTATDGNGNTASCTTVITILDAEPPTVSCSNSTRDTDPGVCTYTVMGTELDIAAGDNCTGATIVNSINNTDTLDGEVFSIGDTNVIWTATDAAGNTSMCTAVITVVDNEDPVITTCQGDTTIPLDANCQAAVPDYRGSIVATDNCSTTFTVLQTPIPGTIISGNNTTQVVILTVIDGAGNTDNCTFIVTAVDNTPPSITCVANTTVDADSGVCEYTVQGTEFDATFTDNCSGGTITNTFNGGPSLAGAVLPIGITTVGWIAVDGSGNLVNCATVITVVDNQAPVAICPSDIVVSNDMGSCDAVVNFTLPAPTDNCPGATVSSVPASGSTFPVGTTTVTVTATDAAGNTDDCTFTVTVNDTESPAITCAADASRNNQALLCAYTVQGTEFDATFTDNCVGGSITNDLNNTSSIANEVLPVGVTTVVWTATDGNGNTASCTTVITILDAEPPTVSCSNSTRDTDPGVCTYTVMGTELDIAAGDNCTGATIVNSINNTDTLDGEVFSIGDTNVIWTATDAAGNTSMCTAVITVVDNEDPVITTCQGDTTIPLDANCQAAVPDYRGSIVATDNCSTTFTVLQTPIPGTIISGNNTTQVVILTVIDGAGNTDNCTFIVTAVDNTPPSITCVANTTVDADSGVCEYTVQGTEFDATFTDNCSGGTITNTFNGGPSLAGAVLPIGTTTVGWIAVDGSGNLVNCTTVITVVDNQAPVANCPSDIVVSNDVGSCDAVVNFTLPAPTDNCPGATVSSVPASGSTFPVGTTTVTVTATDAAGNTDDCTFTVTVNDTESPVITCVADASRNNQALLCAYTVQGTEFDATFTDNCVGGSITNDLNNTSSIANEVLPVGVTTVVWTATDGSGNTASCTTVITILDVEPPTVSCSNSSRDTDPGVCTYTVMGTELDIAAGDNCAGATIVNSINNTDTLDGEVFSIGDTNVIWTATDAAGNTSMCTSVITVVDNEDPVITTCQGNTTISLDANCQAALPDYTMSVTATDNCSTTFTVLQTPIPGIIISGNNTTQVVILTVIDDSGNTDSCTFTVTAVDNTPPSITCVANTTVDADSGVCEYTVQGTEFDPTAFGDNCTTATISNDLNGTATLDGEVLPLGDTIVTWTVDDGNGNTVDCQVTITVEDNEDPTISCVSPDPIVSTDPGVCEYTVIGTIFDPTFGDNCTGATIINNYTNTATLDGAVFPLGITFVVWTVTDGSGNIATCANSITVEDNEDPTITCAADDTRDTDPGVCEYTVQGTEFDPTAFGDNCTSATISNDLNGTATLDGEVLPIGDTTVTWTVDDGNGNTVDCQVTITVEDNEDPTISCVSPDPIVSTDPGVCEYTVQGAEFDPTFSDNCTGATVTNNYTNTATLDGAVFPIGITFVVWTVTDGSGNTATCANSITVEDNEDPVITCIANTTVNTDPSICGYTVQGAEFDATFTDNCTGGSVSNDFNGSGTLDGEVLPVGDTTVVWTATDGSGNTATCTIVITVVDNEPPVIACPMDVTADTDPGVCGAEVFFADAIAIDNCGVLSVIQTAGLPSGSTFPVGVSTVEFTATDVNGNTSVCSFTITVTDNEAPMAVCQDITIQLDEFGNASITAADIDGGSTDNCGIDTIVASQTDFDCSHVGVNNVTLTVTDIYGNVSTCIAVVTVEDVTAPNVVCQDITVELDANGTVTISGIDVDGGSTDACGIASYDLDIDTFDCSNVGPNVVTLTVTDVNGNFATCTAIVTVEDTTDPELTCMDITVELDENGQASITASDVIASATDACGILTSGVDITDFDCDDVGTPIEVTVFVQDNNGNLASCMATVTVVDLLAPVIENCPADQTVDPGPNNLFYELPDYWASGDVTATDNCTDPLTILSQNPAAGTLLPDGTYTITLTAEDEYGNVGTCEFELTVESVLGNEDQALNTANIKLYPNPATQTVYLRNPQLVPLKKVQIFDMMGRLVATHDVSNMGTEQALDISRLATAGYMVIIEGENGTLTRQLIKE